MLLVKPRLLPRMDFSAGIAPDCSAMVVVPTSSRASRRRPPDRDPGDPPPLEPRQAPAFRPADGFPRRGVGVDARATARSSRGPGRGSRCSTGNTCPGEDLFYLFHRPRRWNPARACGWGTSASGASSPSSTRSCAGAGEALLRDRGRPGPVFPPSGTSSRSTPTPSFRATRPASSSGTMAHPLNRPVFDAGAGSSSKGYGIMQPRVGVSLPGAGGPGSSGFLPGNAGIDPYTREVSDVYQDVFQEGSFIGKGIYDVDAFSGPWRALPREHHPQPRPAGIVPRPLGPRERRGVLRGVSLPLQCGRGPAPPLDPRRLADRPVASAPGPGPGRRASPTRSRRCPSGRSSTT
jgi:cyclic beta-1,2-glucan synthetase